MKLIYMDKTIILISKERPELLTELSKTGFEEIKQEGGSYFKIKTDENS